MRKLLGLLFGGVMLIACSGSNPAAPPYSPTPHPAESRQFLLMDPAIAEVLRTQAWTRDGSEESETLLREIVNSQLPRPNLVRNSRPHILQLVQILDDRPWYRDGLEVREKIALTAVFRSFATIQNGQRNVSTGEQVYLFDGEYDFPSLYASALEQRRFRVIKEGLRVPLTLVGLADIGDERLVDQALDYAEKYVVDVVRLAGEIESSSVVVIIDSRIEACGLAHYASFVVRLNGECVRPDVVAHELTHLATPYFVVSWFEEGTAYWVAEHLTRSNIMPSLIESPDRRKGEIFHTSCCESREAAWTATVRGAFAFLLDLELLIGAEAVSNAIKAVPEGSAAEAIPAILRYTPPDKQHEVRQLIVERCRSGPEDNPVPCNIPGPRTVPGRP